MTLSSERRVTVKLFVGYPLTSDLRMHLKQSIAWKQAKILEDSDVRDLVETHFQDKDYIGKYITQKNLTLPEIKAIESEVRESLLRYCSELAPESLKLYLFPQIFIS
jgi:hypothetical protein